MVTRCVFLQLFCIEQLKKKKKRRTKSSQRNWIVLTHVVRSTEEIEVSLVFLRYLCRKYPYGARLQDSFYLFFFFFLYQNIVIALPIGLLFGVLLFSASIFFLTSLLSFSPQRCFADFFSLPGSLSLNRKIFPKFRSSHARISFPLVVLQNKKILLPSSFIYFLVCFRVTQRKIHAH